MEIKLTGVIIYTAYSRITWIRALKNRAELLYVHRIYDMSPYKVCKIITRLLLKIKICLETDFIASLISLSYYSIINNV